MNANKMMKTKLLISFLICACLSLAPMLSHAQTDPGCNPDLPCPIDNGVLFLLAAGLALGAKGAYSFRKSRANTTI